MKKTDLINIVLVFLVISTTSCIDKKQNIVKENHRKNIKAKSKVVNKKNDKKEEIRLKFGKQSINVKFEFGEVNGSFDRKFKKIDLFPKFKLGGITDTIFKLPINVKTDAEQNIYVLDMMDKSVIKFNKSGKFLNRFGRDRKSVV